MRYVFAIGAIVVGALFYFVYQPATTEADNLGVGAPAAAGATEPEVFLEPVTQNYSAREQVRLHKSSFLPDAEVSSLNAAFEVKLAEHSPAAGPVPPALASYFDNPTELPNFLRSVATDPSENWDMATMLLFACSQDVASHVDRYSSRRQEDEAMFFVELEMFCQSEFDPGNIMNALRAAANKGEHQARLQWLIGLESSVRLGFIRPEITPIQYAQERDTALRWLQLYADAGVEEAAYMLATHFWRNSEILPRDPLLESYYQRLLIEISGTNALGFPVGSQEDSTNLTAEQLAWLDAAIAAWSARRGTKG